MSGTVMIPWRVRKLVSEHFPLLYHLLVNRLRSNNSDHWDARLTSTWGFRARNWPTKNALTKGRTSPDVAILEAFLSNYFPILTLESICDENHEVPILFAEVQKVVTA